MTKVRESNYDLLRICSTFAIVMLHVSASFLQHDGSIKIPANYTFSVMLLNYIVRFAVPCFFMLSGAFILADQRNADYMYFYKKSFKKIGITSVIFCILYVVYRMAKLGLSVFILHKYPIETYLPRLLNVFKGLIKGEPYYHLWYLFTIVGLYLAAPFVIRLAADLKRGGVNLYGKATIVFLAFASVSYITSEHKLNWDIGYQLYFLSYFLMGYRLRQWGKTRKNNQCALLFILAGIAVNGILAYINYQCDLGRIPVSGAIQYFKNIFSHTPLAPIEVIASCLIFAGFSMLDTKKNYCKFAGCTFLIYLLHVGVLEVIESIIGDNFIGNQVVEAAAVILVSIAVFIISFLAAILYNRLSNTLRCKIKLKI